jgi:hypothetical protein
VPCALETGSTNTLQGIAIAMPILCSNCWPVEITGLPIDVAVWLQEIAALCVQQRQWSIVAQGEMTISDVQS